MSRRLGVPYALWLCPDCGFAIPSNKWRRHRARCAGRLECPTCRTPFPCRNPRCPMKENPQEIEAGEPGTAPTPRLLASLHMQAKKRSDGKWCIRAPWLVDAVVADTWEDAYWMAVKARPSR